MDGSGFDEVAARADPQQRGLISHCYRMLGSVTDAVEVAGGNATYEAATRDCLERATTRPLPTDLAAASDDPEGKLQQRSEVLWLEPFPDDLADGNLVDLALIAALQRLPTRERAAVILYDLEQWTPNRITDLLGPIDLPAARADLLPEPGHQLHQPALLASYREAFEQYDVPAIVTHFADDAIWEMPPFTSWFRGARNIGRLISTHCPAKGPGDQLLVPIKANRQPAFAVYMRDPTDNLHRAFQIQVLTLTAAGIVHAIAFFDLSLFPTFHLPELLTGLPPNPYDGTPRPHVERLHHPHN
jgi:RNA polymerase sigma-70 factor (ECF subfamily)